MGKTFRDKLAELPPDRRDRIEAETDRLHAEYQTLKELREALAKTQTEVAEILQIRQSSVAQVERQTDVRISTLRRYIEALGGTLNLVIQIPGRDPVTLNSFSDLDEQTNNHHAH